MKKRMIISCMAMAFIMMMLPVSSAVQSNATVSQTTRPFDLEIIQNMNIEELKDFIIETAEKYPCIPEEIIQQLEEIEDNDLFQEESDQLPDSNQSIRGRIWLRIFNYRLFRLGLSLYFFLWLQSRLTLMRTITWTIKVLRWVKVGVMIGVIDPSSDQPPETMHISFMQNSVNKTLTVTSVSPNDMLWSDIDQIGSGSCDPLPTGNITAGDEITNCTGIIILRYIPTNKVFGVFEFE